MEFQSLYFNFFPSEFTKHYFQNIPTSNTCVFFTVQKFVLYYRFLVNIIMNIIYEGVYNKELVQTNIKTGSPNLQSELEAWRHGRADSAGET